MKNVGEAILLLGCMWFGFTYGFSWWIIALMLMCIVTWASYTFPDENKELARQQADYYRARAVYYYSKAKELDNFYDRKR
jgi:hypothetical protein